MEQESALLDIENELNYEPATTGHRFANYLVDMIVFYAVLIGITAFIYIITGGLTSNESGNDTLTGSDFTDYIYALAVFLIYYTLLEKASKGRSVGKWITGTKALKEDETNLTFKDAFLRSLSRCVPFEPFSAFGGYPWHDKWTGTKVVKIRK